jgi:carbon monoxide dehydrogenase subunit G
MPRVEETVTTSAGRDEVWAFLSDFTTTEQWDPPTVSTVRVAGDGGVGTRYQNTSRVLGHDTDIVYTVIEHEAPRLLRLRGESDTFTAEDTIRLSPDGEGTVVSYTADFTFTGAAKLAWPLLDAGLQKIGHDAAKQMAECLDRLAARTADEASERR